MPAPSDEVRVVEVQGQVQVSTNAAASWSAAVTNQLLHPLDRLRSGPNSRMALRWSQESVVSFGALTEIEVLPRQSPDDEPGLHLVQGVISFFHRDQPGRIQIITRGATAGVEGTEFAMSVAGPDITTLSVVDGRVRFGNALATLTLTNGEQAVAEPGRAPFRTGGFIANNLLQWAFYYPAILDPDELELTPAEQQTLAASLAAYRSGDVLAALGAYPAGRAAISDNEHIYHAALLLAVGEVAAAEADLAAITDQTGRHGRLANALRQMIAAVKRQPSAMTEKAQTASEWLAQSYFEQSRARKETSLREALHMAQRATEASPSFGFAWERLAELQFSFGRTHSALKALNKSLTLAPRNAQAEALAGFILAAQDEPKKALARFDAAIALNAALGNAWLGRGLTRIHLGDPRGGRADLLIAAALEPQRAELRSYLGKAYASSGDTAHAGKELALAKKLDPNDPTAWLYSALLNQQENSINDAIRDLEKSQQLNDNRSVYRSQLLLDEDAAVRSANLAWIYRDAGLFDLSVREAARATSLDYANYAAHLYLANSYEQLRDPQWANLRYEAPANDEFWIANLLAPTSAGWLSSTASEKPYAKLFDQNRFGVVSDTTYLDRGAWTQLGAQYGTSDRISYSFEERYISDPGQRPNNDSVTRDLDLAVKVQLTPQDSAFFDFSQVEEDWGDVNEYYKAPAKPAPIRNTEKQTPNLSGGYHHEWSPGVHTLAFVSFGGAKAVTMDHLAGQWVAFQYEGKYDAVRLLSDNDLATIDSTEYSAELQQIWETPNHTTIVGARYFWGDLWFQNIGWRPRSRADLFLGALGSPNPAPKQYPFEILRQNIVSSFGHESFYAYHDWQIFDPVTLFAGVTYDHTEQPADVNTIPFSSQKTGATQTSPKAGVIWTPFKDTTLRAAYTRSLSGLANDSSTQIQPTEVAGFNQTYRGIIPDTVVGDTSGSRLDTIDVSLEQKFNTGTYLAVGGEILYSRLNKSVGAYYFNGSDDSMEFPIPRPMRQFLDYRERSVTFTADQLLGQQWTVGTRYRLSQANLNMNYLSIPPHLPKYEVDAPFKARQNLDSILQTITLHANWNHPSGLFSALDANYYLQDNSGYSPAEPGDDFWQLNLSAGYRFWHRRAEVSVGILNVTDQNYSLEPLDLYNEMARRRTFFGRLLISF